MKKKKNAKERRAETTIHWKHTSRDLDESSSEELSFSDNVDFTEEIIRQHDEGKLDNLPDMSVSFIPVMIDKQDCIEAMKDINHYDLEAMNAVSNKINLYFMQNIQNEEDYFELLNYRAHIIF